MSKQYTIHVDIDSPVTLAKFYNTSLPAEYGLAQLEAFYEKTFERMLETFSRLQIKATFFCVASEIEQSEKIAAIVRNAVDKGHYIANHTYSHPFGLNELPQVEIDAEIEKANRILTDQIKVRPVGFRSPGYSIDTNTINTLEKHHLSYDSSSGWALFHIIFKVLRMMGSKKMKVGFGETNSRLTANVYTPDRNNWKSKSHEERTIKEYPLPASFGMIPCYCNLHLTLPVGFVKFLLNNTRRNQLLIYLMHAIEFSSSEDDFIPEAIYVHPHVTKELAGKSEKVKQILAHIDSKREKYSIESAMSTLTH